MTEVPIAFAERWAGACKMTRAIVVEALWRITVWGFTRRRSRRSVGRVLGGPVVDPSEMDRDEVLSDEVVRSLALLAGGDRQSQPHVTLRHGRPNDAQIVTLITPGLQPCGR